MRSGDVSVKDARSSSSLSPAEVIGSGLCIGCGACVGISPGGSAASRMDFDRYGLLKPVGPEAWLRHRSHEFAATCPFSPAAADETEIAAAMFGEAPGEHSATGRFTGAYVGHVLEPGFRAEGSSGGMVSWVLAELFRRRLIDGAAHVAPGTTGSPSERFFGYRIARSPVEVRSGAKSRYYPVEMAGVIAEIRSTPGRYAVVGVPCFIKAIQLLRRQDPVIRERVVFTLGLFCGHMKSARFVESFAWQLGVPIDDVEAVEFRRKDPSRPASTYTAELRLRSGGAVSRDWWNLVDGDWGAGYFQSSACNFCDDVVGETADISFGDAWVEPYSSDGSGTNVVVTRTRIMEDLIVAGIENRRLQLKPVGPDFVEATQAAGLRQRREGLAYRLTWRRHGLKVPKRVLPSSKLPVRRKLIYRSRSAVTVWSHRVFWLARVLRQPRLYIGWARAAQTTYHALAYSRGRLGRLVERWLPRA